MRIHLKVKTSNEIVPFDHQHLMVGVIHKWLGRNEEHGNVSLYSFSRLEDGRANKEKNGLSFNRYASFFISAHDNIIIKQLIGGIQNSPTLFNGLKVEEISIQEDPDLSTREQFYLGSPIFIQRRIDDKIEHILYDHSQSGAYLKETLQMKMNLAGLNDESFEIEFDQNYPNPGSKLINYKGIKNRASWCPVIIKGNPETKLFAWNVGLGNSTGIGFGAIK